MDSSNLPSRAKRRFDELLPAGTPITRADCAELDSFDPLSEYRRQFTLPEGLVYLDGNSLGPPPYSILDRVSDAIEVEWGQGLIRSWNESGWYEAPRRVGDKVAKLLGAADGTVVITDSISVNLYKLIHAAMRLIPERSTILAERDSFPTDNYIASSIAEQIPGCQLRLVEKNELAQNLDDSVALLFLSHVDYRSASRYDIKSWTSAAHENGTLVLWDLAHSAGAMPIHLDHAEVDFAVGCGYKYLNGGPGAPAFLYVAKRLQTLARQPLSGWFGHARPFDFASDYRPAEDVSRFLCGTPPILSMVALEASLDIWQSIDLRLVREKSELLGQLFLTLLQQSEVNHRFQLASPADAAERGSHLSLAHEGGYAICQAMIEDRVIGDFREPNLIRFGFAPLYLKYQDIWTAVDRLGKIVREERWRQPRFQFRGTVT